MEGIKIIERVFYTEPIILTILAWVSVASIFGCIASREILRKSGQKNFIKVIDYIVVVVSIVSLIITNIRGTYYRKALSYKETPHYRIKVDYNLINVEDIQNKYEIVENLDDNELIVREKENRG